MNGTNYSTGGPPRITRLMAARPGRLASLAAVLLGGLLLVAWIGNRTWTELAQLQQDFAAMKTETFYLGVHLHSGLEELNGTLLRFQLSKADPKERDRFYNLARDLSTRLDQTRPFLATPEESHLVQKVKQAYETYLTNAAPLLEKGVGAVRRESATLVYQQIQKISARLLPLCEELVSLQKASWKGFLTESHTALGSLRGSSQLALALLVMFALLIAVLAYGAMVAPLRLELSQTQAVVARQEKLASLGTLAAGVAHEIRNPLAAIKFRLFSLKKSLPQDLANTEDIAVIGDEINRLERIIKDFLQFARPSEPVLVRVTTQQILQTVHDLLRPALAARDIQLHQEPSEAIWLQADKQQIEQVLINLVQNAADSIDTNGSVTLRARSGAARLQGRSTPAVLLEVADTGKGIPPEVERRLFDPFFSTKSGGTGLGLSIAERIVEKHGGQLQYQTRMNRGTTFQIVLPRDQKNASQDPPHRR